MADRIRLLPEVVANQIAAGEVVDRPASVVKEMMENAIDAGARCIKVNHRDGGKELIQVVDDGCGMSPIDARMAFDRHATSKIRSVDDIYSLSTFGFRGEALASIAAVAQVELRTRQEGDEVGTATEIHGGQFVSQQPVMCPVGSQFFVRNLYYNVPARRRFLQKSTTSAAQIKTEFQRVALCNPQVAFELYANDVPLYNLEPSSLAARIVDVVGRNIKSNLLEVGADSSIARIEGYVGRPAAAKRRNTEQFLFVNGRYFKSAYLTSAILKAYEKLIPEGVQPSYFLYLTIEPERIDVNVHPQKTEVKFAEEEAVWQIVNAAVRETLAKTGAVALMDFDRESSIEIPVMQRGVVYRQPDDNSLRDYNPFNDNYIDPSAGGEDVEFSGFDVPYDDRQSVSDSAIPYRGSAGSVARPVMPVAGGDFDTEEFESADLDFEEFASGGVETDGESEEYEEVASSLEFVDDECAARQQCMGEAERACFDSVMPVGGGYAVTMAGGRLVVVALRRAREAVLYEEYLRAVGSGSVASQRLLFPERLVLSEDEYAVLEENAVEAAALGFDIEFVGGAAIEVHAMPAEVPAEGMDMLLYELLQGFALPESMAGERRRRIAATMAATAAKSGKCDYSSEEITLLLKRLAECGNYSFTPSGKAVMAEITADELRAKLG